MTYVDPTFQSDPAMTAAGLADPNAQTAAQKTSAYDAGKAFLKSLGLDQPGLLSMLTDSVQGHVSPDEFSQKVQLSPEFSARFPGIAEARKNGNHVPTPAEYVAWENTATSLETAAGLPKGFIDNPETVSKLIGGGVSAGELSNRINQGYQAVMQAPQDVKDQLMQYEGVTPGHLLGFFLDEKQGGDTLLRDVSLAQMGAEATRGGFGGITREEASGLVGGGVTASQAAAGFGKLTQEQQLMGALPGEAGMPGLSREAQLGTIEAPQGATQQEIERRARERVAQFAGGGGYAETAKGVEGLGQSAT